MRETLIFHPLVHSSNTPNSQDSTRLKPRTWNSILVFPSAWQRSKHFCHLLSKLHQQKAGSEEKRTCEMECGPQKWQLNLIHHNAFPETFF